MTPPDPRLAYIKFDEAKSSSPSFTPTVGVDLYAAEDIAKSLPKVAPDVQTSLRVVSTGRGEPGFPDYRPAGYSVRREIPEGVPESVLHATTLLEYLTIASRHKAQLVVTVGYRNSDEILVVEIG